MKATERLYKAASDFFEIYLPCACFITLFICYVIMIAYRYIFNAQINEIYELSMIVFVWTVVLSASYHSRIDEHIMFTILYDRLPHLGQLILRMAGNLFIVVLMCIILPKAWDAVSFLAIKKSSLMKIPFNIIYAPFIVFNILTIVHHLVLLFKDARAILPRQKGGQE